VCPEHIRKCAVVSSRRRFSVSPSWWGTDHPWRKLRGGVSENTRSASVKCETNRGGGRKKKEKKRFLFFFLFLPRHRFWCEARHGWEEASVVCLDSRNDWGLIEILYCCTPNLSETTESTVRRERFTLARGLSGGTLLCAVADCPAWGWM
jgi:hypothetical protein